MKSTEPFISMIVRNLIWAAVAVCGLYFVGKPIAEGLSHWMTLASPDKFLDALFSYPTAIVIVVALVGPRDIRRLLKKAVERGFKTPILEVHPEKSARNLPSETPPIQGNE